jgi:hypothetical protein
MGRIFFSSRIYDISQVFDEENVKTPTHRALFIGWGKKAEQNPHDHMVPSRVLSKLLGDNQTGPIGDVYCSA